MKSQFKFLFALLAITVLISSCSNDETSPAVAGTGKLNVEFDNIFGSSNLILDTQINATAQGENLKISDVKYIISNIVLTNENGATFTFPKAQSYFIVSERDALSQVIELANIPSGNYTKIKFGIGVDEAQFNAGQSVQGNFFAQAQDQDMAWTWSAGYKHLLFEGTFISPSVANETVFMVHTGKSGANYNYTEVTLNFPDKALVRTTITPDVHIFADVKQVLDGTNAISLTNNNTSGLGAMIMTGNNLALITANLSNMFSVDHVHND